MLFLIQHWLLPARIRRLPLWARLALLIPVILLYDIAIQSHTFGTSRAPVWDPAIWLCGVTMTGSLFAGAVTVASERQSNRWEALTLTHVKSSQIVHAMLIVRLLQGCALLLPFMVAVGTISIFVPVNPYEHRSGTVLDLLIPAKNNLDILLRLIAGTMLGLAISSACKRVLTAVAVCGALASAFAAVFVACHQLYQYGPFVNDDYLHAHLVYWPIMPLDSFYGWKWDRQLIADGVWGLALPVACYLACRILGARRETRISPVM